MTLRRVVPRWMVALRIVCTPLMLLGYLAYWPCAVISFGWTLADEQRDNIKHAWRERYRRKED